MPRVGFGTVTLKQGLIDAIDAYVSENDVGFTNRAELISHAVREFFEREQERRARQILAQPPKR